MMARNPLPALYCGMRFEKIWAEQCRATKAIRRRFGAKSALDYLIGEELMMFADAAKDDPDVRPIVSPFRSSGANRLNRPVL